VCPVFFDCARISRKESFAEGSTVRSRLVIVVLLASLVATCTAQQPTATPPLQDILLHLQENLWDYMGNVPNFFADEHVVSVMKQEGARDVKTTTDSVFRLRRSVAIGEAHTFTETREIKTVNKKAAKGSDIQGPTIFSGAFSTAVSVVSLEMSRCFDYTIEPMGQLNNAPAIVIDYAINPDVLNDQSCPGPEKQSGKAWIDPVNFHPLRVEMVIPNHKDNHGIRVLWRWSVDYAPVTFDSRQFWMPKTITSNAEANDGSAIWSFVATYSNYHKLTVNSRIITDVGDNPPPPPQ
jgi:hypothetical protein